MTQSYLKQISHLLPPFTYTSWCGRSEETPLRLISEWPYVSVQWKWWLRYYESVVKLFSMLRQSDCPKKITTVFVMSLYIYNKRPVTLLITVQTTSTNTPPPNNKTKYTYVFKWKQNRSTVEQIGMLLFEKES
jgi:hypothetical protein